MSPAAIDQRLGPRRWFTDRFAQIFNYAPNLHGPTWERLVKSHFGASLDVVLALNNHLNLHSPGDREHLLWALHFLTVYNSENVSARFWKVTEKTYRKYLRPVVNQIAALTLVCRRQN